MSSTRGSRGVSAHRRTVRRTAVTVAAAFLAVTAPPLHNATAAPFLFAVNDVFVFEGDNPAGTTVNFFVSLDTPATEVLTVEWATTSVDAIGSPDSPPADDTVDYLDSSGTVAMAVGATGVSLPVHVWGDVLEEPDETFKITVTVRNDGGDTASADATATIVDDDKLQFIAIGPISFEGNFIETDGPTTAYVGIARPSGMNADETVAVTYTTYDGDATIIDNPAVAPDDYAFTTGRLVLGPGERTFDLPIPIVGDNLVEGDECFTVVLSDFDNVEPVPGYAWTYACIEDDDDDTIAPAITGTPPAATRGTKYNYTFDLTGMPAPTVSLTAGALPKGVTLTPDGQLTGTPTKAGTYRFTVTATNGTMPDDQLTVVLVVDAPTAPTISGSPPSTMALDAEYSYQFTLTGAPTPRVTVVDSLPPGLSITSGGLLSGVPLQPGNWRFTLRAANGVAPTATRTFSLTVYPSQRPADLKIELTVPASARTGEPFVVVATVTNNGPFAAIGAKVWLATDPPLPSWGSMTILVAVPASTPPTGVGVTAGTVYWDDVGTIPAGASKSFTVTYSYVPLTGTGGTVYSNASVWSFSPDNSRNNNIAYKQMQVAG